MYTIGVFLSISSALASTEPRHYGGVFGLQKSPRRKAGAGGWKRGDGMSAAAGTDSSKADFHMPFFVFVLFSYMLILYISSFISLVCMDIRAGYTAFIRFRAAGHTRRASAGVREETRRTGTNEDARLTMSTMASSRPPETSPGTNMAKPK